MTKAEAIAAYLEKEMEQRALYKEARVGHKGTGIVVPERLVPIVLLALDAFYSAYSFGTDALRDREEASGVLMSSLTSKQADSMAAIMGNIADFRREYAEAHE